jgi:predicted RNA-binding Zn ribbon-like protein
VEDHPVPHEGPLFIADNLALDFINTAYGVGAGASDYLDDDAAVVRWLAQAKALPQASRSLPTAGLLTSAREFRDAARHLVEKRQAQAWADPAPLNRLLALGSRYSQVQWPSGEDPVLTVVQPCEETAAWLLPIADALAALLAEADVSRVRCCASDECTLLFRDMTRSHRRRWCDMSRCGNRAKVNSFRKRQGQPGSVS